jgi:DNA-binding CsgD family transcriptional regulator
MFPIDIRTVFLGYVIINITSLLLIALLYLQIRRRFPQPFIILLSFLMSSSGNILLFLRNIFPDWISIIVGNTLVISSTVILMIGFEQFVKKRGTQIQNYFLIIIFIIAQSYFTFFKPDLTIRSLNISISYVLLSSQIAWLMLLRVPLKIRIITRDIGLVFCVLFFIHISRIILIIFKQEQTTNYFNLDNSEAFFLFSYQIFIIMLAYSISLMYNKSLIIDVKEQEKKITLLSAEKHQLELDFKNKELSQNMLHLASLKEVNKNILIDLDKNLENLIKIENFDLHKLMRTLKSSSQEAKIWEEFDSRFKEANSNFYVKLLANYPTLSKNEIRVACLLHQNYTTKEISEILQRSVKTIENIRGLVRKKINLPNNQNLTSFLLSIK